MSLFDSLASAAVGSLANRGGPAALVPALIDMLGKYPGGIGGLLQQLQQGGLGNIVTAWLGGKPEPVEPAALDRALEPGLVDGLAERSGQARSSVLDGLSVLLPRLVNLAAPDGKAESARLPDASQLLGALGGLLGKRA